MGRGIIIRFVMCNCIIVLITQKTPIKSGKQRKIVLHANRTLKLDVLHSNPLLADLKLQ